MSRQVSQRLQHSGRVDMIYIADPTTNAVFGTVDPFPIEIAEQSLPITISGHLFDTDSNLKVTGPVSVSGSVFSNDATVSGNNLYTTTRAVDSGINYTGNITALTTYTSSAELTYEPDVGMFAKATSSTVSTNTDIGILKFQFSPDNVNWSSFPVAGFTMASNIWEFHTAVKLPRYFRYSFDNCASTDCSLDAYAYYGHQLRQGSLPLSQSIGTDNDAIVTRSVGIGQEPNGSYQNVKKDGSAFRTTTNLQGTTLQTTMTADTSGNISLGDTTGFGTSGYIYIGSEFIQYTAIVDSSQITIPSTGRGAFGSTAGTHAIGDTVGEVYTTGILTLEGYTEVATKLLCSNTGRMRFQWYSDSAGTDNIRTIGPAYSTINTYDFLGAPIFGPYVRYTFANTQSSATTDFYFETEFYTKAISAQVLTVGSTIVSGMTANLGRNIVVGEQPDGDFVNVPTDGNASSTDASLGAGASYNSLWIDTDGYNTIEIFVSSDVSSATQGLAVAFSNDTGAVSPIASFVKYYDYNQTDIDNGYKLLALPTALDGYKITYTNGDTSQSTFELDSTLKTNGLQLTDRLNGGLTDDREATVVRSVTLGKNPANAYVNTRQDGYVLFIDGSLNLPYLSSILDTDGYTQIQTDVFSDVSGTLTGTWYNDSNQTTTMRTFAFPYNASRTLESFSSPVFARYLTYGFSADGSAQAFNLGLKFLTKSLSGQVLGTTSTVVGSMVANLGRNILMGQDKASNFKNVPIDVGGNIKISVPTTAFGQIKTSEETPLIEQYFPYGVLSDEVNTRQLVTNVTASGGSGTGLLVDYEQTGNAVTNIFANRGNTGVNYALNDIITVSAGNLNSTGIIRSVTSTGIVLALDVCVGGTGYTAADGSINTIDGLMQITVSGAYDKTVVETKDYVKYHTGTGIITRNTAIFEPSAGSYQFVGPADTNDGFLCGFVDTSYCIVRRRNGVDNITYQNSFNVDTLNGVGGTRNPSAINSNFTYGNVYQIKYQWLGFGAVKFSIEDGDGNLELYHTIQYANANSGVSVVSPSYPFRWEIGNTTNTSNLTLKSASAMAAIEGKRLYPSKIYSATATSLALVLQNRKYFKDRVNKTEVFINSIIITNNTTNTDITFTIRKALSNPTVSSYTSLNTNSVISTANPAVAYASLAGDIIGVYALSKGQTQNIRLSQYELDIRPTEYLSINPSAQPSSITVTWFEDK
jgi:hypothetical protein